MIVLNSIAEVTSQIRSGPSVSSPCKESYAQRPRVVCPLSLQGRGLRIKVRVLIQRASFARDSRFCLCSETQRASHARDSRFRLSPTLKLYRKPEQPHLT